ncbi:hypothetical protein EMIT0P201_20447 [Pseudomonas chlororaphis]
MTYGSRSGANRPPMDPGQQTLGLSTQELETRGAKHEQVHLGPGCGRWGYGAAGRRRRFHRRQQGHSGSA